jgi:hypothetical protein
LASADAGTDVHRDWIDIKLKYPHSAVMYSRSRDNAQVSSLA